MSLTYYSKNKMLDYLGMDTTKMSLHTASPGDTGDYEYTYAGREDITWTAASNGSITVNEQPVFNIEDGTTITHLGLWDVSGTSDEFVGYVDITDETWTANGTLTVTSCRIDLNACST